MDRALENRSAATAAKFVVAMRRFWERQGYLTEGLERTEWVLKNYEAIDDSDIQANLLFSAGALATENGRLEQALHLFEQSVALSRDTHNLAAEARGLNGLGTVAYYMGNMDLSDSCFERALEVKRQLGDQPGVAASLNNLAIQAMSRGDYSRALTLTEESVLITESLGDLTAAASIYNSLGAIREALNDLTGAKQAFERGNSLSLTLGVPRTQARALINLGIFLSPSIRRPEQERFLRKL
jgi:tetratricopeptide (TPR) repeat protein